MTHPREWHEERRRGIGASDVAAVLGISPWKSPAQVWRDKVTPLPDDYVEPPTHLKLWLGTRLEEVIAELYTADTGINLRRPPGAYWHRNGVMFANLDFIRLNHSGHVEAKVASFGEAWGEPGTDEVPKHYYPQVQAQLACRPAEYAEMAVLWHGQEFRRYPGPMDDDYVADLDEYLTSWWNQYVVGEVEPPLTAMDIGEVKRRFPRDDETEMVATPEQTLTVDELRLARVATKAAERVEGDIEVAVRAAMGTAAKLVGPGFNITYRTSKPSTSVSWEQVAAAWRSAITDARLMPLEQQAAFLDGLDLDAVESIYTATKEGSRVFRPTWKEHKG